MTASKNGVAIADKKTAVTPAAATPEKSLPSVPVVPFTPPATADKLPPLDDRLHRINQLFDLHNRYLKLQESHF